jgi:hypothetical protein
MVVIAFINLLITFMLLNKINIFRVFQLKNRSAKRNNIIYVLYQVILNASVL